MTEVVVENFEFPPGKASRNVHDEAPSNDDIPF
jgi:hypothetical protein